MSDQLIQLFGEHLSSIALRSLMQELQSLRSMVAKGTPATGKVLMVNIVAFVFLFVVVDPSLSFSGSLLILCCSLWDLVSHCQQTIHGWFRSFIQWCLDISAEVIDFLVVIVVVGEQSRWAGQSSLGRRIEQITARPTRFDQTGADLCELLTE